MSADSYYVCPKCGNGDDSDDEHFTLEEDWEIGVTLKGTFYVNYSAFCANCGWEMSYDHEEILNL